jgi:nicotinamidase-related amidase
VVDKLTSSAFHATMLDHALRNMGVTDLCVSPTPLGREV